MNLEVSERRKNPLMKREEVRILIEHRGKATPDRASVLGEVAKLLKSKPENIIIDKITTPGGSTSSVARVLVYDKRNDIPEWRLKKMEQRLSKLKKGAGSEKEGESEKTGSEAPQEDAQQKESIEKSQESNSGNVSEGNDGEKGE